MLASHKELGVALGKPVDLTKAEPKRKFPVLRFCQNIVPLTKVHIDRQCPHIMLTGIAHDLRWRIKPHRL
ncbi:hypothetical protein D3C80_1686290 [compost metagenome]